LLNLEFGKRITTNDLLIAVRLETVREAENVANIEIRKVSNCAKDNKRTFNE